MEKQAKTIGKNPGKSYREFRVIPGLVPCGPLKEVKKSAILRDWSTGNQQLAIGNLFSH